MKLNETRHKVNARVVHIHVYDRLECVCLCVADVYMCMCLHDSCSFRESCCCLIHVHRFLRVIQMVMMVMTANKMTTKSKLSCPNYVSSLNCVHVAWHGIVVCVHACPFAWYKYMYIYVDNVILCV